MTARFEPLCCDGGGGGGGGGSGGGGGGGDGDGGGGDGGGGGGGGGVIFMSTGVMLNSATWNTALVFKRVIALRRLI